MKTVIVTMLARLPPARFMIWSIGENARDNWNGVFSIYSAAVATIGSEAVAASRILENARMRFTVFSRSGWCVEGVRPRVTVAAARATLAQTVIENKRAAVPCAGAVAGEPCFGSASMLRSAQRRPSHATPSKHPHERVRRVAVRGGRDPLRLLGARRSGRARAGEDRAAHLHPRGARRLARQDALRIQGRARQSRARPLRRAGASLGDAL